jgi:hypothetical protein
MRTKRPQRFEPQHLPTLLKPPLTLTRLSAFAEKTLKQRQEIFYDREIKLSLPGGIKSP